jgi:molecular chaperone DnaK (HSP70)
MRRDDLVVGIDLGTTNTALGFVRIPAEEARTRKPRCSP